MQSKKSVEFSRSLATNHCPECGEVIDEQAETYYLLECDRCLSKRDE